MDKTGGPAFPSHASLGNLSTGMSLRDYFAGQALCGMAEDFSDSSFDFRDRVVRKCYEYADAMLKERYK